MAENRCPKCSSLMPEGFRFCTACGSPMNAAPIQAAAPAAEQTPVFVQDIPVEEPAVNVSVHEEVAAPMVAEAEEAPVQVFFPQSVPVLTADEPVVEETTGEELVEVADAAPVEEPVPEFVPMAVPEVSAPAAYDPPQWQESYAPVQPVYEQPAYQQPVYEQPVYAPPVYEQPVETAVPMDEPVAPEVPEQVKKLRGKEKRAAKKSANAAAAAAVKGTKYEPVKAWGYVANYFLMGIPVLNVILLIVWAFGGCRKIGRRNWARSLFIVALLQMLFFALAVGGLILTLQSLGLDLEALANGDFTQLEQLVEYVVIKYLEPAMEEYGPVIEEYIVENFN